MTHHALATPKLTLQVLLQRLSVMSSRSAGLSSIFMLLQYSSPLVIGLLLRLARLRANLGPEGGKGLIRFSEGWGKLTATLTETRIVMRLLGLPAMLLWAAALHPKPLSSLKALVKNPESSLTNGKAAPTIQALSMVAYYLGENIAYLSSKGVIALTLKRTGQAMKIATNSWGLYVIVEILKIFNQMTALQGRTARMVQAHRSHAVSEAEGYELQQGEGEKASSKGSAKVDDQEIVKLQNDWEDWVLNALVYAGYGPLTAHWCMPGGLWPMTNLKVYTGLATVTGIASVLKQWKLAAQ